MLTELLSTPSHYEVCHDQHETLFVLHQAGETNDLIPIINALKSKNNIYYVLTLGVAAELAKDKIFSTNVYTLNDLQICSTIDKYSPRTATLSNEQIEKIADSFFVSQVVCGVPTLIEAQIIDAFKRRGVKTLAYWDNLSANGPDAYFATALKVQKSADLILLPSKALSEAEEFADRLPQQKILIGKPSMKEWKKTFESINTKAMRAMLGIKEPSELVITWIGGYGLAHKKAFELFVSCLQNLSAEERPSKLIIQNHPNANKEELDPYFYFPKNDPMILAEEKKISTIEAAAIADVVISYNSTAALQAMLLGKKVIFVVPEGDPYSNIAIDKELAYKVSDADSFSKIFKAPCLGADAWQKLGIPEENPLSEKEKKDSISRFLQLLEQKNLAEET